MGMIFVGLCQLPPSGTAECRHIRRRGEPLLDSLPDAHRQRQLGQLVRRGNTDRHHTELQPQHIIRQRQGQLILLAELLQPGGNA